MKSYETIFIMSDKITEEQRIEVLNKIQNHIKTNGKLIETKNLGLKKLAYEIKKHKKGHYYIIEFDANKPLISELERIYRISDEIIKFITIKKD